MQTDTDQLPGDELTGTEPEHFAEFSQVAAMAAELEGIPQGQNHQTSDPGYQPVEAAHITSAEILAPVVGLACDLLAPSWNIGPEEKQALAESYGALVDKYFPEGIGAVGVELNAFIITGAILAPRLGTPRKPETKDKAKDEGGEDAKAAD